jgi:hypothetical protein
MSKLIKGFQHILILLLIPAFSFSQDSPKHDFSLSAQAHTGYIISHHSSMMNLIKGHIYGVELNYIFRTDGSKQWQQMHGYPEIGISALHMFLSNPDQLGSVEAVNPYLNFRLNKQKHKTSVNLRVGVGLAYLTKSFDRITDHKNVVIGSHLNGFVNFRLNAATMLSPSWKIYYGVGLSHASNGAIKTPNLGLNMATVNVGLAYVFGNKMITLKKDSIPAAKKYWQTSIIGVVGIKEMEHPGGPKYTAYGLQANLYRVLGYKNKLGGGIEMGYNNETKKIYTNDSIYNTTALDIVQVGAKVSYAFTVDRLSVPIDFGVYIFKRQSNNGIFFHRIGLRYMVTKHIIANVTLLTHWAKADYFEWGIGYQF